jgi:hypothetical protein
MPRAGVGPVAAGAGSVVMVTLSAG